MEMGETGMVWILLGLGCKLFFFDFIGLEMFLSNLSICWNRKGRAIFVLRVANDPPKRALQGKVEQNNIM